ncbi:hypothetical protein Q1695_010008 [Nippostrongylus brasiliensis]|nr:hypothetical protein Q1695_010008 [Nippostrongylus brasiliensis]
MSWNSAHPRTWALEKYTNIISKESSMEPDLHAYLYQNLRELVIAKGKGVLERISLSTPHLSAIYRETSVLFAFPGQSQGMRFRIRLKGILDRQSFCLAISEFIADIRESPGRNATQSSSEGCGSQNSLRQHGSQPLSQDGSQFLQNNSMTRPLSQASLSRPAGAPIHPPYSHSPLTTPIKTSPPESPANSTHLTPSKSNYLFSPVMNPEQRPRYGSTTTSLQNTPQKSQPSLNASLNSSQVSPSVTLNLTQSATLRQSQYSFSPLTPPQKAPRREVETQTEQFDALSTDPEELRIALKKVMQDESFHRTVKRILEILPSLDGALDRTL